MTREHLTKEQLEIYSRIEANIEILPKKTIENILSMFLKTLYLTQGDIYAEPTRFS